MSALELLQSPNGILLQSQSFNSLFHGQGIPFSSVTEIYGFPGSGKTQLG
jgi:RecA/RadA recombinase